MEDYPEIVYKYRNWKSDWNKKVISENSLFLAPPNQFNDPFDCKIPDNLLSLDNDKKLKAYLDIKISQQTDFLKYNNLVPEEEKKKAFKKIRDNIQDYQNQHQKILFDSLDKHIGVLSLSARWDSILMWSHYGDYHKGYCVGFYEEKLKNSGLFGMGGTVIYNETDEYPFIDPLSDNLVERVTKRTLFKAKEWAYEKEYRLTKMFFPNPPKQEDRVINIPNDFFAEITLGIDISEKDRSEIMEIAQRKKIKVFQAEKAPFKFLIHRKEVK